MFELLRILIEKVAGSFKWSDLQKGRKDKHLTKYGSDLLLFYFRLNETIVIGRAIVSEIENGLRHFDRKTAEGRDDFISYLTDINTLLRAQGQNIIHLVGCIKRFATGMQLIDGSSYRSIIPLITGKINALKLVVELLDQAIPKLVVIDPPYVQQLMFDENTATSKEPSELLQLAIWKGFSQYDEVAMLKKSAMPIDSAISKTNAEDIRGYMRERNPSLELDKMEVVAENFRRAVEANFSLSDILLRVGDHRLLPDTSTLVRPPDDRD